MTEKPNFLIFIADDQGWGDLSCQGAGDFVSPNVDALATGGCRFVNWYSNAPICSASRAALLTGGYPANAGVPGNVPPFGPGLRPDVPTLAEHLKPLGYRSATVGKWHLGDRPEQSPINRGFDQFFGFTSGCIDYFSHIFYWAMNWGDPPRCQYHDLWENDREIHRDGEFFLHLMVDEAKRFIRDAVSRDEPFFLYMPFNAPHYPMHAPAEYLDRYAHLPWARRVMLALLSAVDDAVGAVVDELKRQGQFENTCILYTSDHGPSREPRNWLDGRQEPYPGGTTGGLRGHKFSLFDGGVHVPGILHWPRRIPGCIVRETPVASMDVVPSFLQAAGATTKGSAVDGSPFWPVIDDGPDPIQATRALCWKQGDSLAVRQGDWKLVLDGEVADEPEVPDAVHLSNLREDWGERNNLADAETERVEALRTLVERWQNSLDPVTHT